MDPNSYPRMLVKSEYQYSEWTPTKVGSTDIAYSPLTFTNLGAGTAGVSVVKSPWMAGKQVTIVAALQMVVGDDAGDGGDAEVGVELWYNADNFIRISMKRAAGINALCYVNQVEDGVSTASVIDDTDLDTAEHTFTIVVFDTTLQIFVDNSLSAILDLGSLYEYNIRLVGGTIANLSKITAMANKFMVSDFVMSQIFTEVPVDLVPVIAKVDDNHTDIGTLQATANDIHGDLEAAKVVIDDTNSDLVVAKGVIDAIKLVVDDIHTDVAAITPTRPTGSGTVSLSNTSASTIEFTTAAYGADFLIMFGMDIGEAQVSTCYLYDASAGSYSGYTSQCNDITANNIPIVPPSGAPQANDAIYFGSDRAFRRVDIVISGNYANTDHVFVVEIYNGSTWATPSGLSDGTKVGSYSLAQSGTVTFSVDPGSWTVKGTTRYWIRWRVTTAGSANSYPYATHVQLSDTAATDFHSKAAFGSLLAVKVFRKVSGSYPTLPSDSENYIQNLPYLTPHIEIRCYSDTKIVFQLSATPSSTVSIPYSWTVVK